MMKDEVAFSHSLSDPDVPFDRTETFHIVYFPFLASFPPQISLGLAVFCAASRGVQVLGMRRCCHIRPVNFWAIFIGGNGAR